MTSPAAPVPSPAAAGRASAGAQAGEAAIQQVMVDAGFTRAESPTAPLATVGFALVLAAFGIGGAVGSLVISSLAMPRRYVTTMIMLWAGGTLPLALLGITDLLWVMALAAFAVSFTMSAGMVIWGTLLQRRSRFHGPGRLVRGSAPHSRSYSPARYRSSSGWPPSSAGGCPPTRLPTRWSRPKPDHAVIGAVQRATTTG